MKYQAIEQSFRKPQGRKIPKIALLIALAIVLSVVSIYSPSLCYNTKSTISKSPPGLDLGVVDPSLIQHDEAKNPSEIETRKNGGNTDKTKDEQAVLSKAEAHNETETDEEESEASKSSATDTQNNDVNKPKDKQVETSKEDAEKDEKESEPVKSSETEMQKNEMNTEMQVDASKVEAPNASEKDEKESEAAKTIETEIQKNEVNTDNPKALEADTTKSSEIETKETQPKENCDLFTGEWVPNPGAPYYTNSCYGIQDHQNCMGYQRPDTDFMRYRWQPDGCELPIFDPQQFLELVRGKSIAFVGDSVARNHMQSLLCLLSRVIYPQEILKSNDENKIYEYKEYNFTMSILWAPYLVRSVEITAPNETWRSFSLYLDEFDESWTNKINNYDYIVISDGHWFFRPLMFYENSTLVGCQYCRLPPEVPRLSIVYGYQRAFRTAFRAINSMNYKGVTFLRTFAPAHFENGTWDNGGNCVRTRPFKRNETSLEGGNLELYKIQLDELKVAQEEGRKTGSKFRLFDATKTMLLRPDGHPSKYGHKPIQNVEMPNDCVHWCLPGPIDAWSDFMLELLKREEREKSAT
ncbi:hypothetical protein OROHE_021304 [Orobanche hederae]